MRKPIKYACGVALAVASLAVAVIQPQRGNLQPMQHPVVDPARQEPAQSDSPSPDVWPTHPVPARGVWEVLFPTPN